ncbi:GyrI-like domain-containing protein [Xylanimonas protaetiae]|nr:GyrI-like domain-containing protein [Xylanimonas protaetiae]
MSEPQIEVRAVPEQHVARLEAFAPRMGPEFVGPVVGPLFGQVPALLDAAGVPVAGPPLGVYEAAAEGEPGAVRIVVAFPVAADVTEVPGLDVGTLPGLERAAVLVHHGGPDTLGAAWMAYLDRLAAEGYDTTSHSREVYVSPPDVPEHEWDTLLVVQLR